MVLDIENRFVIEWCHNTVLDCVCRFSLLAGLALLMSSAEHCS